MKKLTYLMALACFMPICGVESHATKNTLTKAETLLKDPNTPEAIKKGIWYHLKLIEQAESPTHRRLSSRRLSS